MDHVGKECAVDVLLDGQRLTPRDLVDAALSRPALPLTFVGQNGHELNVNYLPSSQLLSERLRDLPSTSRRVALCHYEGIAGEKLLSTLSACGASEIAGIVPTRHNNFILGQRNTTNFVLYPQTIDSCDLSFRGRRQAKANPKDWPDYYRQFNDGQRHWRYVELALSADHSMYKKYGEDETKLTDRLEAIANAVNSLYFPLNIRISLVWVDIWKDGDHFAIEESGDRSLDRFIAYRKSIAKEHPNDNAHLLTNIRFEAGVVGKAYKGTMCSYDYSGGIDVDHNDNAAAVAATVAHEMGHNFGMEHDADYDETCKCPANHCIMAPSTGYTPPTFWSDCSLRYLSKGFKRGVDLCLKNEPSKTVGKTKCGNGVVEYGEECDCGNDVCLNKCCDGKTCKLVEKAQCAEGDCCDLETCQIKQQATVCRSAKGKCDLPEFCNGETSECPADFFVQNGHTCPDSSDSYCFEGKCGDRNEQCQMLWGETGKNAVSECYDLNRQGIFHGNCGFDIHSNNYTRCRQEDVQCGRVHCDTQLERPIFGDPSTVQYIYSTVRTGSDTHQCHVIKSTYYGANSDVEDPGMVFDGSSCGNGKICVDTKCQSMETVTKMVSKCKDDCHGRGICNNVGNCHCENGYSGVACELPGYGGSVNSNSANDSRGLTISSAFLILMVLFGVIFSAVCFYYWFKKKRNLPAEIWKYMKDRFKLHGTLVPTRKAPPPPRVKQHMRKNSLEAVWGDRAPAAVSAGAASFEASRSYVHHHHQPSTAVTLPPLASSPDPLLPVHKPMTTTYASDETSSYQNVVLRPEEAVPSVPSRPRESRLEQLYKEHGNELGITNSSDYYKQDKADLLLNDKSKEGGKLNVAKVKRADSQNRPGQPPPPIPKHQKSANKPTVSAKPVLPKKPPAVQETIADDDSTSVNVKSLREKFNNAR